MEAAPSRTLAVTIRLHGELRARYPDRNEIFGIELSAGATVQDALDVLGNPRDTWLTAVNGAAVSRDHKLQSGDAMDLFPALEGG